MGYFKNIYTTVMEANLSVSKEQYKDFVVHCLAKSEMNLGIEQQGEIFNLIAEFVENEANEAGLVKFNEEFFDNMNSQEDYFLEEAEDFGHKADMVEADDLVNIGNYESLKQTYELASAFLQELVVDTMLYALRESK